MTSPIRQPDKMRYQKLITGESDLVENYSPQTDTKATNTYSSVCPESKESTRNNSIGIQIKFQVPELLLIAYIT